MLWGLPFWNVLGLWSAHFCSSPSGSGPPEVPAPGSPPAPRFPPRSPASLYDACVLMSGARDAEVQCICKPGQDDHAKIYFNYYWTYNSSMHF